MNESLSGKENNEPTTEPKLFGLPRPLAGALIGFVLFMVILALSELMNLRLITGILLLPNLIAVLMFGHSSFIGSMFWELFYLVLIGISSFPYVILGALMFSKKSLTIKITVVFVYILFLMCSLLISFLFFALGEFYQA